MTDFITTATLNVPNSFSTVQLALASIKDSLIDSASTVTINVASGIYSNTTPILIQHPTASRIFINGAAPVATTLSGVTAVAGSAGNRQLDITVGSTSSWAVNQYITIGSTTGPTGHHLLRGIWKILSINSSTTATIETSTYNFTPATGTYTGTINFLPTLLTFTGSCGIIAGALGGLSNISLAGDATTAGAIGIWDKDYTSGTQQGTINIGPNVGVSFFHDDGVRANYQGSISANCVFSSTNGNNGFLSKDSGNMELTNCISSGNGFAQVGGGGNGFLSQLTSSMELLGGNEAHGNWGDGFYARTTASMISDASSIASYNVNGFRSSWGSYFQGQVTALNNTANGFLAEYNGTMLTTGATASGNANGFVSQNKGYLNAAGSTISSVYNGFYAPFGGFIDATSCNVTAIGAGNAAYVVSDFGYIIATGHAGSTACNPGFNSLGNNNGYVKS